MGPGGAFWTGAQAETAHRPLVKSATDYGEFLTILLAQDMLQMDLFKYAKCREYSPLAVYGITTSRASTWWTLSFFKNNCVVICVPGLTKRPMFDPNTLLFETLWRWSLSYDRVTLYSYAWTCAIMNEASEETFVTLNVTLLLGAMFICWMNASPLWTLDKATFNTLPSVKRITHYSHNIHNTSFTFK